MRNTDFKSPFKFILNDINISLELLNSINNKLNFHPELSEKIFDHVTFIRRNKDSKRSLNHYSDICCDNDNKNNKNNNNNNNNNINNNNSNNYNKKNSNINNNNNYTNNNNNNGVVRYGTLSQFDDTINILNDIKKDYNLEKINNIKIDDENNFSKKINSSVVINCPRRKEINKIKKREK